MTQKTPEENLPDDGVVASGSAYEPPQLVRYGRIAELTAGGSEAVGENCGGMDMGGMGGMGMGMEALRC